MRTFHLTGRETGDLRTKAVSSGQVAKMEEINHFRVYIKIKPVFFTSHNTQFYVAVK